MNLKKEKKSVLKLTKITISPFTKNIIKKRKTLRDEFIIQELQFVNNRLPLLKKLEEKRKL